MVWWERYPQRRYFDDVSRTGMSAVIVYFLVVLIVVLTTWMNSGDEVSCIVSGAGDGQVNGYYAAANTMYSRLGGSFSFYPDIFDLTASRRLSDPSAGSILFLQSAWMIASGHGKIVAEYTNSESASSVDFVHFPPSRGWTNSSPELAPAPTVSRQVGNLEDSPMASSGSSSNVGELLERPVNTSIMVLLCLVAYYLWNKSVEVSKVSFSYDAVVNRGEYWRMVTASLSHFELLHLGFNCMAMYVVGDLELVYGSLTYAHLSVTLIFVTMALVVLMYAIAIHKYGQTDYIQQQAVGYSCVVFAWLVALSVRLSEFCPIFFIPSFCIKTWVIPIPGTDGLPVNLGPFVLLIFTKFIVPRSSFIGHLAGILIGYPLAWNWLNGLTPPILLSLVLSAWLYFTNKSVWRFPGFEMPASNLTEFVPPASLGLYRAWTLTTYFLLLPAFVLVCIFLGWTQILIRGVEAFLLWSALQARRVEYYETSAGVQSDCAQLCISAVGFVAFLSIYDLASLIGGLAGRNLLLGGGLSASSILFSQLVLLVLAMAETAYAAVGVMVLNEMVHCKPLLESLRLDNGSLQRDLAMVGISCTPRTVAFSGRSNRLDTGSSVSGTASAVGLPVAQPVSAMEMGDRRPQAPAGIVHNV